MEYEHFEGPDGLDTRVPTDDTYRACSECGADCEPEPSAIDEIGVRVAFVCPTHGAQSMLDPFSGLR